MHNKHTSDFKVHEAKTYRSERQIHIINNINILHIVVDTSRQKIRKSTGDLNNTIDQLDLIDIYKTLYPTITNEFLGIFKIFSWMMMTTTY